MDSGVLRSDRNIINLQLVGFTLLPKLGKWVDNSQISLQRDDHGCVDGTDLRIIAGGV